MAKASDNLYPYVHLVPAAAPSSPSAGSQRLYLDSGDSNKLKRKDSSGTVTTIEGGSGSSGGVLASVAYNPGTITTYTTSSATVADVDATNLAVTFTAPASGIVIVTLSALATPPGSNSAYYLSWHLRESTTTLADKYILGMPTADNVQVTTQFRISGISAGSHTYKWAFSRTGSGSGLTHAGGIAGAAVMKVESA